MTSLKTIQERPKLITPLTTIDKFYEALALGVLVAGILYSLWGWMQLPEVISTHFNARGNADGHGSKNTVFLLICTAIGIYTLITILSRYPHIYNYPVKITAKNAKRQYSIASSVVRLLKLETMLTFAFLEFAFMDSALRQRMSFLPMALVCLSLVFIFITLGNYCIKSAKTESES